jgi:hypothetical protein
MPIYYKRFFAILLTTPCSFTPRCVAVVTNNPEAHRVKELADKYVEAASRSTLHKIQVVPIDIPKELLR